MCFENDRKAFAERIVNNWTIHTRAKNTDVPQPSKHHQNVWLFWWWKLYLHHFGGWNRRPALPPAKKIRTYAVSKSCSDYEASLWICQLNSLAENNSQRYQTLEYSPAWSKRSYI